MDEIIKLISELKSPFKKKDLKNFLNEHNFPFLDNMLGILIARLVDQGVIIEVKRGEWSLIQEKGILDNEEDFIDSNMVDVKVGNFVKIKSNNLGIGKIYSIEREKVEVEYFISVGREPEIIETVINSVSKVILQDDTPVYSYEFEDDRYHIGRIVAQGPANQYYVRYPNDRNNHIVAEEDLYIVCDMNHDNFFDNIKEKNTQTSFFYQPRKEFREFVINQRAVYRSLDAYFQSSIELEEHQFFVVNKVLRDPIQRYLLADEVGLGKTIEAGVILKQYTLDEPETYTCLVIVPKQLKGQWLNELECKFFPETGIPTRISVISENELEEYNDHQFGMVIVDEVHHISSYAFRDDINLRERYYILEKLTKDITRLLLLSATPVLNNEESFLAILHLLDPSVYSLADVDSFKNKIDLREQIARYAGRLIDRTPDLIIKKDLKSIRKIIQGDHAGIELTDQLSDLIESEENDDNKRSELMRWIFAKSAHAKSSCSSFKFFRALSTHAWCFA